MWFYNPTTGHHIRNVPVELEKLYPGVTPGALEHPRELTAYLLAEPAKYGLLPGFITLVEVLGGSKVLYK